jgi:hypothetical protein
MTHAGILGVPPQATKIRWVCEQGSVPALVEYKGHEAADNG